jgi:hypothetical protein
MVYNNILSLPSPKMLKVVRHISLLLAVLFSFQLKAQTYPIQTFVQVTPPFTSYLPDYTDPFNNQMKVLLTLMDFSVPSYQVKLRFTFEGSGYTITTSSLLNVPPVTVTPGVPVEISGTDLAPYLNSANLIFTGINVADYEQRKVLPEGPVSICVEVIDFSNPSQAVLSNPACAQVWFSLNDPPLVNAPFCGTQIQPADPQQIFFSWTPLHMNLPNSMGTQYTFELFEIRPDGADPNQVVNSTLPIFMQVTDQTFINYGITEPQLQLGMSYAWRVKAQDNAGHDFFRNNGYSAVCTFTYGNIAASLADGIVLQLNSNGTGVRQGLAWWNASSTFTHYKLEVRKTGNPDYEWFPYNATTGDTKINSLEPNTEYECRVKGLVGDEYESEWSNISVFKTQAAPDYACSSTAMPAKSQAVVPLTDAIAGMYFTIGQFEMLVTDIQPVNSVSQPGHYKGTGKINVQFVNFNLRVKFDDILVDENLMVRSGKVEAISEGLEAWENSLVVPDHYVDGVITNFEWNDSTSLTVWVDGVPQEFEFPADGTLAIQDDEGMIYIFNSDGTFDVITVLVYGTDQLAATKDLRVDFSADEEQQFGFDKKQYAAWIDKYEVLKLSDNTNYFVSFKSLAPLAGDYVIANITSDEPLVGLTFLTSETNTIVGAEEINDSTYRLSIPPLNESEFIYAWHNNQKIGKLWVKVLPQVDVAVVIVPVNGATLSNLQNLQTDLNAIYAQANANFTVTIAAGFDSTGWDLNADAKLQNGDPHLMTNYSDEMRALRDAYFAANPDYNKDAYHLFVIPGFEDEQLAGYMVRGKGVGFLKDGEDSHTAAHELGHGVFGLEHTFPEIAEGASDNLMDYAGASHLAHWQWLVVGEPLMVISIFDEEEEGELMTLNTNDYSPIFELENADGSITFLSLSGDPITLKGTISKLSFCTYEDEWHIGGTPVDGSYGPMGALVSFEIDGVYYSAQGQYQGSLFTGYYSDQISDWYYDSLSFKTQFTPVIVLPTYSYLGFRGSAFRINKGKSHFITIEGGKASGTVSERWAFLDYVTKDSILTGVNVVPRFSQTFSFETLSLLSALLFNNSINPMAPYDDTYDLFDYEFYEQEGDPVTGGYLEKYIGYEALLIYQAAYLIENHASANDCYLSFSQVVSAGHRSGLYTEYYNALNLNQTNTGGGNDIYASDLPPLIFIPPQAPMAMIGFPEPERQYKLRRLTEVLGGLKYYNKLIASFDHNEEFSDLESAVAIRLVNNLSNDYSQELGNCLIKMLNPATKIKIMSRVFDSEWSDAKEELVVRMLENTTPEQFEEIFPALAAYDCALFNATISDIWFSHYDRYMNYLSYHILEYQSSLPGFVKEALPYYDLYKDGLSPLDTETDFSIDGCMVNFYYQPFGIDNPSGTEFDAWDLVRFNIKDDFVFPSFTGVALTEGDVIVAPAIWAYYFLDEHGQHTNAEAVTYFLGAALSIWSGGASMGTAIELVALGTSFVAHIAAEEYATDQDVQDFVVAIDWITLGTIFTPTKLATIGLPKVPWVSVTTQGTKQVYQFVKAEYSEFLKLLRAESTGLLDEFIKKIDFLIDHLGVMTMVSGAKQQFLVYLLYVQLNAKICQYGRVSSTARLAVNHDVGQVELFVPIGSHHKGDVFEFGDMHILESGQFYFDNLRIYDQLVDGNVTENGVLLKIDELPVMEDGVVVKRSYEVVYTSLNRVLLREVIPYTAVFSREAIVGINGFSDNIESLLTTYALNDKKLSLDDFKNLIINSTDDLSGEEKDFINLIRNSIPAPTSNTVMQKVITLEQSSAFFVANESSAQKSLGGYMTTAQDAKHLNNYNDILHGMRLDYSGSAFVTSDATSCVVIRFQSDNVDMLEIPRNFNNGGTLNDPGNPSPYNKNSYPFTGHGFTSGDNGTLGVPEWRIEYPNALTLKDGAEMYIVNSTGVEELIGIYSEVEKKFIVP